MRALVVAGLVAGCGFAPSQGQTVVEAGADGFTGELGGGSVASRGAIEPDTYYVGGLRARGYHNEGVTATTTSADLPALFTQPTGEIVGQDFAAWGDDPTTGFPRGLGLGVGNHDHFSVVVDGEIWLPLGTSTYVFAADDAGFLEIEIDGAITGVHASFAGNGTLTLTTARAGWYPIRGAMSESIGTATFVLVATPANIVVPPAHLRSKTTDMRGLVAYLFYLQELEVGPFVWLDHGPIDHEPLVAADWNLTNQFSIRYAGQLRIDTPGTHALAVDVGPDTDDTYRIWIEGQLVASHWLTVADQSHTANLLPGWHALAVDYGNNTANASVHLRLDGMPVPADHLRPAVAWGVPATAVGSGTPVTWNDQTPAIYTMTVATNGGELIDTVDLEYGLSGTRTGTTAALDQGGPADPISIRPQGNETDFAPNLYDYDALRTVFAGMPLAPAWHFTVTDHLGDGLGGSTAAVVPLSYHGGPLAPFAPAVTYTSPPHATPGAVSIDRIHVDAQLAAATLAIAVRTAGDPARLATAPWIAVEPDSILAVAGGDFVQFQLVLAGDGWTFPSVERVELSWH